VLDAAGEMSPLPSQVRSAGAYSVRMENAASVPSVGEPRRKATYDDVLAAPEHEVAEILDGELYLSPRPAFPHARASSGLGYRLGGAFDGPPGGPDHPGGWWLLFEPELHFADDVVVPDLAGWRHARMPRVPNVKWHDVAPDWVCETLSPSTARIDRSLKLGIYARAGVADLWLVDPIARTLEVLMLDRASTRWRISAVFGGSERVHAEPFAAKELELATLWTEID